MELIIFKTFKSNSKNDIVEEFRDIETFCQDLEIINKFGATIEFAPNKLAAWLYIEKEEFDKIPKNILPEDDDRNLDLADDWSIYMTMEGLVFFERLRGNNMNITIDAMGFKSDEIRIGDIIRSGLDNNYYIVKDKLYKSNNINALEGSNEPYDSQFLGYIPLIFVNKVTKYEVEKLKLIKSIIKRRV